MRDRAKIVHLIDNLASGGAQEFLLDLARHLDRTRFDMRIWCLHGHGSYIKELLSIGVKAKSLSLSFSSILAVVVLEKRTL